MAVQVRDQLKAAPNLPDDAVLQLIEEAIKKHGGADADAFTRKKHLRDVVEYLTDPNDPDRPALPDARRESLLEAIDRRFGAPKKANSWTEFLKNNKGGFRNLHEASIMYRFQKIKGAVYEDIVALIPADATSRVLTPIPGKVTHGIEYKWVSGGVTNRVRLHGSDPSAPAGSNAASGWVARIQRGNRVLDDQGRWQHGNSHNPASPFYNPAVANATHIPIQAPRNPQ
ncbi:MAG: polymorphic toxin type 30 domain-containing protein [Planctomycetia bacterium]